MTDLRTAAQQALDWLYDNDILHPTKVSEALRAALAQQDEPVEPVAYIHRQGNHWEVSERFLLDDEKARGWTEEPLYTAPPRCPNCASLEAQNTELDRKLAELERAESAQEPVDVGLLEYRGNSVAFIHQKMTAYRAGIDAAWDAFKAKGLHPDGKTSLADMIAKYTAPPQRKPLTKEQFLYIYNQLPNWGMDMDSLPQGLEKFGRAVERAHGIGEQP